MLGRSLVALAALALVSACLGSPAVAAQKKAPPNPEKTFKKLDTNADGKLTLDEFKGKGKGDPAKVEKRFRKLDTNHDNALTLDEFKAAPKPKKK